MKTIKLIDTDTNTIIMRASAEDVRIELLKNNLNRKEKRTRYIIEE